MKRRVGAILVRNNRIVATGCAATVISLNQFSTSLIDITERLEDSSTAMKADVITVTGRSRQTECCLNAFVFTLRKMHFWRLGGTVLETGPCSIAIRR